MSIQPPHNGTDTSIAAADSVRGSAESMRVKVLGMIVYLGSQGATCDEIEQELFLRHQTASARVNELMNAELIVDSGQRRRTRSGRKAKVWATLDSIKRSLENLPASAMLEMDDIWHALFCAAGCVPTCHACFVPIKPDDKYHLEPVDDTDQMLCEFCEPDDIIGGEPPRPLDRPMRLVPFAGSGAGYTRPTRS